MASNLSLLSRAYRGGWLKERKLHLIWRAIARRHAMRAFVNYHELHMRATFPNATHDWPEMDGESDP